MNYTPREITENVNVSKTSPLREFFVLSFGIIGTLIAIYIVLGLAVNLVVPHVSPQLEDRLSIPFTSQYDGEDKASPVGVRLQQVLDALVSHGDFSDREYRVHLVPSPMVNAMALPGGNIVVFSGLVNRVQSENELAMVLGHELGHFKNRDHLRGLGRGLVLMFLSSATLGVDSSVSKVLQSMLVDTEMKFSQKQELQADLWGLDLLRKTYGHAGGATDFFTGLGQEEKHGRAAYFFATHPYPERRVRALESVIRENHYAVRETIPLDPCADASRDTCGEDTLDAD